MVRNHPPSDDGSGWFSTLPQQLRGLALHLAGQEADAEDLIQDTLLKAWKLRDTVLTAENRLRYVGGMMQNLHVDGCRKKQLRVGPLLEEWELEERLGEEMEEHATLPDVHVNRAIIGNMSDLIRGTKLRQAFRQLLGPTSYARDGGSPFSEREMQDLGRSLRHWLLHSYSRTLQDLLKRFLLIRR